MDLAQFIRNVPDFPKAGIQFKDITTLLKNGPAFKSVIDGWRERYAGQGIDAVVGVEARGFMFGGALAYALQTPFVPVRKPGKLPSETLSETYHLEYGTDAVEIHKDALKPGDRVVMIDDLLATGGTMGAAVRLIERLGAEVFEIAFLIELPSLKGRGQLQGYPVHALFQFMPE